MLVIGADDGAVITGPDAFQGFDAAGGGFAGAEAAQQGLIAGRAGVEISYCRGVGAVDFPSLAVPQAADLRPSFRLAAEGSFAEFRQEGDFLLHGQVVEAL